MAKSIDPGMTITAVQLEEKTGSARGEYVRAGGPGSLQRPEVAKET
jgi:hypothetical protein